MGSSRVFLGIRQGGVLTCFDTWTRDHVVEEDPYILLGRVLPPLARIGLNAVAVALARARAAQTSGSLESAVEYWLADLEEGVAPECEAGVVEPNPGSAHCGIVIDLDARAVDWLRRGAPLAAPVEERGVDAHGFVAALRISEENLAPAGEAFQAIMNGRFEGVLERPECDDWELRLLRDKDASVIRAVDPDAVDEDDDELPPGFVRHDLYAMSVFIPTEQDTLVATGRSVDGRFAPTWATVAKVGEPCWILVEPGDYEIWHQRPAPFIDPIAELTPEGPDFTELVRAFDAAKSVCESKGKLTVDPDDDDGPLLSFVTGSLDAGDLDAGA